MLDSPNKVPYLFHEINLTPKFDSGQSSALRQAREYSIYCTKVLHLLWLAGDGIIAIESD